MRRVATQFARCVYHLEAFRDKLGDPANLALQETLALRPSLMACVIHPYLNVDWRFDQKLDMISRHYKLLNGRLGALRFPLSPQSFSPTLDPRPRFDSTSLCFLSMKAR